jgi:hypothetical protein
MGTKEVMKWPSAILPMFNPLYKLAIYYAKSTHSLPLMLVDEGVKEV